MIAEVLGHGDTRTTKRYSHVMEEAKREAVEMLAETGAERQKRVKNKGKEKSRRANLPES